MQEGTIPATMSVEEHTPTPQEARGIYGFVFFLLLKLFIFSYFVWMLLPLSVIQSLPYAPPQQYWGIAVPVFICTTLFMFAFFIYPGLHGLYDCNFDDLSSITDPDSHSQDYFETVKSNAIKMTLTPQESSHRRKERFGSSTLKTTSAEICEKSKSLSAKEKQFRDMQIRPFRSFPECDTKPIPPVCDLDLDVVCKKIFLNEN